MAQEIAEVILKVNSKEPEEKIEKLEKKAADLRKSLEKAVNAGDTKSIKKITNELNKTNTQIQNMRTNAANIRAALKRLDEASPKDLQRTVKLINAELNSGRVKRGSKEWDDYVRALHATQSELNKVKAEMKGTTDNAGGLIGKIKEWQVAIVGGIASVIGIANGIKSKIGEYVEAFTSVESEMANVSKYTGLAQDDVKALNAELQKIDTRTSIEGLNQLAQEAGRLGKQSVDDVLGFVRAADQINVALDDLGEGATLQLSKLTSIFGDEARLGTERSLLATGSVINELSQNCAASAPYIAEFAARLGGVAAQSGMTSQQVMAFAAVLDTAGVNVEASSTALQQFMVRLYQDPAKYAKSAGIDVKTFSNLVKTDLNGAMLLLLDTVSKAGGMDVLAPMFADMGEKGSNAIKTLSILSGKIDDVKSQQEVANKVFDEAISITNEFNVQNSTAAAQLDKAKNQAHLLAAELGEKLYPVMMYSVEGASMALKIISTLIDFVIRYRGVIIATAASIAAYNIVVAAATIKTKALAIATTLSSAAQSAWRAVTLLSAAAANLMTGNVTRAAAAMKLFNTTIKLNPLGLLISGLTAAIGLLIAFKAAADDASSQASRLAKADEDAAEAAKRDLYATEKLYKKTQDTTKAMGQRLAAAEELKRMHSDTFRNLSAEAIVAGQAANAYAELARSITAAAKAKSYEEAIGKNTSKMVDYEVDQAKKLENLRKLGSRNPQEVQDILNSSKDDAEIIEALIDYAITTKDKVAKGGAAYATPGAMAAASTDARTRIDGVLTKLVDDQDKIDALEADNEVLEKKVELLLSKSTTTSTSSTSTSSTSTYTPSPSDKDLKKAKKERAERMREELDAAKAKVEQEQAINTIAYVSGLKDYEDYTAKKRELDMKLLDDQLEVLSQYGETDGTKYADILVKRSELLKKWAEEQRAENLRQITEEYEEQKNIATDMYVDINDVAYMNDRVFKQRLFEAELAFLQKKAELYKDDATERQKIEKEIADKLRSDAIEKAKETADAMAAFEEQYRSASGGKKEQMELSILDALHDQQLISEEEYQKARQAIIKKYQKIDEEKATSVKSEYTDIVRNIYESFTVLFENLSKGGQDMWNSLSDAASASFAVISAMASQYSAYSNAERTLELAKIEKKYDAEIAAAGNNKSKVAKIEEQKSAAIAKMKKKYNDRAMKIELAQALAQTAQSAIAAYASAAAIPVTGWLLAPIAAGMATAAGMLQVATIKKQHEAEAIGYYEGGYTGGSNYHKTAGVVHEGEFVMNHHAVNNPNIAPILRLIDNAQRNNTVASLTAADVSNAIGQGQGISARGAAAIAPQAPALNASLDLASAAMETSGKAIDRLSDLLEDGIDARVVISGPDGLDKKYKEYQRLNNNHRR